MSIKLADAGKVGDVRYSWMFCEVCERNYRELLVRFEDGSVFTLCPDCALDLRDVVEMFGLHCSISRMA